MGAGKTTLGMQLAERLGRRFVDLDHEIAREAGQTIPEIFTRRGEVTAEYMPRLVGIPGARLKIAGLDIPGLHLDLIEYLSPKGAPQAGPPNDVGNVHVGFTVDDMWAAYDRLKAAGVQFMSEPVSPTAGPNKGGWAVYFVDPDGMTLEMIQRPKVE